ncbi:hypothetical protein EIP86_009311 [Pleurotus ostreatoroseus]|nr:hypothetical protein EIP86_009311 [Pleurotus ostreatoroseus]
MIPRLASLPPELFDEIISYFPTVPLNWYHDTAVGLPDSKYAERAKTLRALAATCRGMRVVALPRLWARLDICFVPATAQASWYKYVMHNLKRKAEGVQTLSDVMRGYVRTVTFTVTKVEAAEILPYIPKMLSLLVNVKTIQVTHCKIAGEFKKAIGDLCLPSVRTLVLPSAANALIFASPNVTHVRCAGGSGSAIIAAMQDTKCEMLDGMIDWCADPRVVDRLVRYAPLLTTLEIRRPVNYGLGIMSQNTAPADWAKAIPKLSGLKQLRTLTLTFPRRDQVPTDLPIIKAAREVMRKSKLKGEKKLIIRRMEAPHYTNNPPHELDLLLSSKEESFRTA